MSNIIVHISSVHDYRDPRIFEKECQSLVKAGYEVHLITPDSTNENISGVHTHEFKFKAKNRFERFLISPFKLLDQAENLNPEIIHFHDPEIIWAALSHKDKRYKIIYDIHEDNTTVLNEREYIPYIIRPVLNKLIEHIEKRAHEELNTIIAERYYTERFPNAKQVLNYPRLDWVDNNLKRRQGNRLLYTGNVRVERGALNYAQLLNDLPNIEFHLIGRCKRELKSKMEEIAGDNKNNLYITGIDEYVPFKKISKAYNEDKWLAGLAIFPYSEHMRRKELTKFFEYMAAGLPIIYSDFPAWKELLDPLELGIAVNPNDQEEVSNAVIKLSQNENLWYKYSRNSRKAAETYNWDSQHEKLLDFYSSILKNN